MQTHKDTYMHTLFLFGFIVCKKTFSYCPDVVVNCTECTLPANILELSLIPNEVTFISFYNS